MPPVDSIVNVYETTVPCLSATVRCVVDGPSWSFAGSPAGPQSPPGTDALTARSVISARRVAANSSESRQRNGTRM